MTFEGMLVYSDDAEFELHNSETGEVVNISKLLDGIYNNKEQVFIKVMKGSSLLFEESGGVFKKYDDDNVFSAFVCGENLDLLLFNNTDEQLEITIKKRGNIGSNYGNYSRQIS